VNTQAGRKMAPTTAPSLRGSRKKGQRGRCLRPLSDHAEKNRKSWGDRGKSGGWGGKDECGEGATAPLKRHAVEKKPKTKPFDTAFKGGHILEQERKNGQGGERETFRSPGKKGGQIRSTRIRGNTPKPSGGDGERGNVKTKKNQKKRIIQT